MPRPLPPRVVEIRDFLISTINAAAGGEGIRVQVVFNGTSQAGYHFRLKHGDDWDLRGLRDLIENLGYENSDRQLNRIRVERPDLPGGSEIVITHGSINRKFEIPSEVRRFSVS